MSITPRSGSSYFLSHGGYEASISSIGASLRELTHQGRHLVHTFDMDEVRPAYKGATLAPWPNRIIDGRYRIDGQELQLPLSEPKRGHALHGLALWLDFVPEDVGPDFAVLLATIEPQTGYPFRVEVRTTYRLGEDGLTTTVELHNVGAGTAPAGASTHSYLVAGGGQIDEWTLESPAQKLMHAHGARLLPGSVVSVEEVAGAFDFREARRIGETEIDHAFTDVFGDRGAATVTLTTSDGSGVGMTWGADAPWVQIFTSDQPGIEWDRQAVAVEPMTCAPDAFNSGLDLAWLEPGERLETTQRIFAITA